MSHASSGAVVYLAAGTYAERLSIPSGLAVTIQGAGAQRTVLDAGGTGSVVTVQQNAALTLVDTGVTNGHGILGGGIAVYGSFVGQRDRIYRNQATWGGGVYSQGSLALADSLVALNEAHDLNSFRAQGGGLEVRMGSATINSSTIEQNTVFSSDGLGGGIANDYGQLTVADSTISGNIAAPGGSWQGDGGGVANHWGIVQLTHVTLTDNFATRWGSLWNAYGMDVDGSIIAGGGKPTCSSPGTTYYTYDLDVDGTCVTDSDRPTDVVTGQDPQLGPLADNGGLTPTRALPNPIPAAVRIPVGDARCDGSDQRGISRRLPGQQYCAMGSYQPTP